VSCEHVSWKFFKSYLEISNALGEIHFDSDLLEFDVNEEDNEELRWNEIATLLGNKKLFINVTSESSLENITQLFYKKRNLDISLFSKLYPAFQLERMITKIKVMSDDHKQMKVKDMTGQNFKHLLKDIKHLKNYKSFQIMEVPLTVLDQD